MTSCLRGLLAAGSYKWFTDTNSFNSHGVALRVSTIVFVYFINEGIEMSRGLPSPAPLPPSRFGTGLHG